MMGQYGGTLWIPLTREHRSEATLLKLFAQCKEKIPKAGMIMNVDDTALGMFSLRMANNA